MKKIKHIYILTLAIVATLSSCIENDIPFPTVPGSFLTFSVRGEMDPAQINTSTQTVTINIADTVDMARVKINEYSITEDATISPEVPAYLNLNTPQTFTIETWQKYEWKIIGVQTINRNVIIDGQVGNSVIDVANHNVIVYVPDGTAMNNLRVTDFKLGPSDSKISPDPYSVTDFSKPQKFIVTYRNVREEWTVFVMQTEDVVTTQAPSPWVKTAYLKGIGRAGASNGFYYKKASDATWIKVDESLVVNNGSNFSAKLTELAPATDYMCRAYSGADQGDAVPFTTEAATQIPNFGFEQWHTDAKGQINPWIDGDTPFWGTGNPGSMTLKKNVTTNTTDVHGGTYAAKLTSEYIVLKFAAGNIFAGSFLGLDGLSDGILSFGQPYTSHATSLTGYYKYQPAIIDKVSTSNPDLSYLKGRTDSCFIYVALCDWNAPLEIRTKPSNRRLFDKNDPGIIAYGEFITAERSTAYKSFTIDLQYRSTDRRPKYIVIVATASKYGDYFTGGNGSTLYLDDFNLGFD